MRDLAEHAADFAAAGARVLVLTTEDADTVRAAVDKRTLNAEFALVTPALWAQFGLANPKRSELPYPATLVVAPDGALLYREVHVNFRKRSNVAEVARFITDWRAGLAPEAPEAAPARGPAAPDWGSALSWTATRTATGVALALEMAPGFHVYGTREEISRPLALIVDGHPDAVVTVPEGAQKSVGGGVTSWVLEQRVVVSAAVEGATGPLSGTLNYQLCTDSLCAAPTSAAWIAE